MAKPAPAGPSKLKMAMTAFFALVVVLGLLYAGTGYLGETKLARMQQIAKARADEMKALDPGRPVLWGEATPGNAWDDYAKAVAELRKFPDARKLLPIAQKAADADPAVGKAALAAHGDEVLGHLRRGAARTSSRYPYEWEKGITMPLPSMSEMQAVASLAVLKARSEIEERKSKEATGILLDVLQFGRDLGADGVLISEMVGIAIMNLALTEMRSTLAAGRFDWPSHEDLSKSLGVLDANFPKHDRALLNDGLLLAGAGDPTIAGPWGPHRMLFADAIERTSEWMTRAGKAETLPWAEARKEFQTIEEEARRTWNPISQISAPNVSMTSLKIRERRSQLRMARIAAHFLRTGEVLEQEDPFGGKLQTKRTGDALRIWTPGTDGLTGIGDWKGEGTEMVLEVTRK
jgi:hypothetical protein